MDGHIRYYEVAGMTIQVESDLPITDATFAPKFASFRVESPGDDVVVVRHHFGLPDLSGKDLGQEVYRRPPWAIYRSEESWHYLGIAPDPEDPTLHCFATLSLDHADVHVHTSEIYEQAWRRGGLESLTLFPTDQVLLARLLADREGCIIHSSGLVIRGQGLAFVGHSEAGKSTAVRLAKKRLGDVAQVLSDDRNILRRWPGGFKVYGTWSHGEVREVSSGPGCLRALLFLEQHQTNKLLPVDGKEAWTQLLATLVKPLVSAEWWSRQMDLLERVVAEVPCYTMRFDKSGAIVGELERLVR
ncbi:MAG: hypothetical protein GX113_05975 [Actinobacteria bacterium]|nr:hypothetical protein [Actinomycetota bacterium]